MIRPTDRPTDRDRSLLITDRPTDLVETNLRTTTDRPRPIYARPTYLRTYDQPVYDARPTFLRRATTHIRTTNPTTHEVRYCLSKDTIQGPRGTLEPSEVIRATVGELASVPCGGCDGAR